MSLERIFKALVDLGLSEKETQVYLHLATKGPNIARKIVMGTEIRRQQIYRILNRLEAKGILKIIENHPKKFSVLPFEETLNLLIERKKRNAKAAQNNKKELLANWKKED